MIGIAIPLIIIGMKKCQVFIWLVSFFIDWYSAIISSQETSWERRFVCDVILPSCVVVHVKKSVIVVIVRDDFDSDSEFIWKEHGCRAINADRP